MVPVWEGMPTVEYLKGRVGLRHVKMNWSNSILQGFHCIDFFEVKYWPKGKASLSFVTSAIKAKTNEDSADYSTRLEVEKCKEYTYVIRVSKSNPTVVVSERGSFMSKCKNNNNIMVYQVCITLDIPTMDGGFHRRPSNMNTYWRYRF